MVGTQLPDDRDICDRVVGIICHRFWKTVDQVDGDPLETTLQTRQQLAVVTQEPKTTHYD